jgi:hypothetical protein
VRGWHYLGRSRDSRRTDEEYGSPYWYKRCLCLVQEVSVLGTKKSLDATGTKR